MDVQAKTQTSDNVEIRQYDLEAVRDRYPAFDSWTKHYQRMILEREFTPDHVGRISNVTCTGLHEYIATLLTVDADDTDQFDPPAEIAFGDDSASGFSTSDTALNNEVGSRITVTDPSSSGSTFTVDEYLSSNEQNGNTLRELGIFSESGVLYQHSATDQEYAKDSLFALIISIQIPVSDA